MSLFSWFENLFGGKWTNETVVQYDRDVHNDYSYENHINQLRNRRPTLHHTQRLLVDSKIRELNGKIDAEEARQREERRRREAAIQEAIVQENWAQRTYSSRKETEASKPVAGNVTVKLPMFTVDVDDHQIPSKARDVEVSGSSHYTSSHSYTPSHSSSHSHSCSSSHSSSDSGSYGGGCD